MFCSLFFVNPEILSSCEKLDTIAGFQDVNYLLHDKLCGGLSPAVFLRFFRQRLFQYFFQHSGGYFEGCYQTFERTVFWFFIHPTPRRILDHDQRNVNPRQLFVVRVSERHVTHRFSHFQFWNIQTARASNASTSNPPDKVKLHSTTGFAPRKTLRSMTMPHFQPSC